MLQSALEVALGLFVGPLRASLGQHLETEISGGESMATVAARVPWTVLQENRLDPGFKHLEVERRPLRRRRIGRRICWLSEAIPDPIGEHLPFRVVLRCPKFTACVRWVSSCLDRERMKQQPAFHGSARSYKLGDCLEVAPRLFLGPRRTARREWLQPQSRRYGGMTIVATHPVLPLFEEDRLDAS